ncbi:hypothetical protein B0H17DRAFT_1342475 [Mycena rosella]|uniref:Uncharacterized protein n=1 Tax=Mycena rosella TaxID=1033263 RepID=A0AAD7AWF5_MYCRO|nr:hypothetical protein B0H17DRAFT_1342475 [Mycena rosella]
MDSSKVWAQVTAQGLPSAKRPSVINTLTDGLRWQFVHVTKIPDQVPPSRKAAPRKAKQTGSASTSTALPTTSLKEPRRTLQRRVSKQPALSTMSETKPFKAASTRVLDIFKGQDLAIVLRLLTLAILSSPEEFERLAAAG